jgi:hypothetical protein
MSDVGRTTWWPKDAAWHRRGYQRRLGRRFGASGLAAMDVMWAWAQEQRTQTQKVGFFYNDYILLQEEACLESEELAREIVAYAVELGALIDFDEHQDGNRFRAVVNGLEEDQRRGRESIRKRDQRAAQADEEEDSEGAPSDDEIRPDSVGHVLTEGGRVPSERDTSHIHNLTREDKGEERSSSPTERNARARGQQASKPEEAEPDTVTLPASIARHGTIVHDLLTQFAAQHPERRIKEVSKRGLARVLGAHPRHPLVQACHSYLAWQEGEPKGKAHKDLIRGYEWQLDNRHNPLAATEQLDVEGLPTSSSVAPIADRGRRPGGTAQHAGSRRPAAACPVPDGSASPEAEGLWQQGLAALRQQIPEQFEVWTDGLHVHSLEPNGALLIGGHPDKIAWLNVRLQGLLSTATGHPVLLHGCGGAQPTEVAA